MIWLLVFAGYLAGSIPFGLLLVLLVRGVDVRKYGSGKTGMTNVLRTAGKPVAALVLLADTGKGVGMALAARLLTDDPWLHAATAAAVIVGHVWPVFAGFRGGRGIAPGLGAAAVLAPWATLAGVAVFIPVVALTRFVSLGSVLGVAATVAGFVAFAAFSDIPWPYVAFAGGCGGLIIAVHTDNIRRLLNGTERRIGQAIR